MSKDIPKTSEDVKETSVLHEHRNTKKPGEEGGTPRTKGVGMLVVPLRGVNFGF